MNQILAIAIGGGIGSVLRHYSISILGVLTGAVFPYSTLFVNVVGSFLIGFIVELVALRWQAPSTMQLFLVTGFLGGFTTFSAFSLDIFKLAQTGHTLQAAGYAVLSVIGSFLALLAGVFIVRGVMG